MALAWKDVDWEVLDKLRARFLDENSQLGPDYWASERELAHYDLAFAPRIGWKWDAVLAETRVRGWQPGAPPLAILDWGCGTGVATRRLLNAWSPKAFSRALFWDRSERARAFAVQSISTFELPAQALSNERPPEEPFILLVSHVINELHDHAALLRCARAAQSVFWVEPGTPVASRRLIEIRQKLRGEFQFVAPCPHQETCGLSGDRRPEDWCHHFASPPAEIFQSAEWEKFSRRLKIDRRSLPTSFLVMSRTPVAKTASARVLGRPRVYKGYGKALVCRESGVEEITVRKKESPEEFRDLDVPRFARQLVVK